MKTLYQAAVVALALLAVTSQAATKDLIGCELKFYGSVDAGKHPGPMPRAPLFATYATLGAERLPGIELGGAATDTTFGFSELNLQLGEQQTEAGLIVFYMHAIKNGADGKPEKAVQKACVQTKLAKNGVAVLGSVAMDCREMLIDPSGPIRSEVRSEVRGEDPFDPKNNWVEVPLDNGVPRLVIDTEKYIETPSGEGVLKIACTSDHGVSGPVDVKH